MSPPSHRSRCRKKKTHSTVPYQVSKILQRNTASFMSLGERPRLPMPWLLVSSFFRHSYSPSHSQRDVAWAAASHYKATLPPLSGPWEPPQGLLFNSTASKQRICLAISSILEICRGEHRSQKPTGLFAHSPIPKGIGDPSRYINKKVNLSSQWYTWSLAVQVKGYGPQSPMCLCHEGVGVSILPTPAGCPTGQLSSDPMDSDSAGKELSPIRPPNTADTNHKSRLLPVLLTDWPLWRSPWPFPWVPLTC